MDCLAPIRARNATERFTGLACTAVFPVQGGDVPFVNVLVAHTSTLLA